MATGIPRRSLQTSDWSALTTATASVAIELSQAAEFVHVYAGRESSNRPLTQEPDYIVARTGKLEVGLTRLTPEDLISLGRLSIGADMHQSLSPFYCYRLAFPEANINRILLLGILHQGYGPEVAKFAAAIAKCEDARLSGFLESLPVSQPQRWQHHLKSARLMFERGSRHG